MAAKKIGKMKTETVVLLGVGALAVVYLLTRTTAQPVNPYATTLVTGPQGQYLLPGNNTAQLIQAGGSAASSLIDSLNKAGIFG